MPASGGDGSIGIKTERECQWTAQAEANWLTITAGATGQGDGTVQFKAAANSDPVARSAGVMVNGLRAQITQSASECRFELANSSASFSPAGGSGTADVRASSELCTWTAVSNADWIAITSNRNGKGSASVAFSVAATTGAPRTATLTIAGLHFSITQAEGCTFAIAPVSSAVGAAGGSQVVRVTAGPGCPWTAASNADWITVGATSGTGSGTVALTIAPTSGPARTGSVTIAGQTLTVMQSPGCALDVSPLTHTVDAAGGTRTIAVTGSAGCAWTASTTQPWITIAAGAAGSGSGVVTITIAGADGPPRSGTVVVAGQTVTITQGNGCAFGISLDTQSVPSAGGSGTVSVTSASGCAWSAKSNASWITVTAGASGAGNGTVRFTIAGTNGPARSGTLTIAGRTFTVNQGQGCAITLAATSASVPAGGGSGTFDVRTADGCGWSAASNANWLTITGDAGGSGNGTVRYAAAANAGPQRSGTITAGGHTFAVTQAAGCSYSIAPPSQNVGSEGGNATVTVTAPAGCSWNAAINDGWIGISGDTSGSGNGAVHLVVSANSGAERRGTATIAGQTFTIVQVSGCAVAIAPAGQAVPSRGGSGSFSVNTTGGCAWTATPSDATWISITAGAGGNGPGTVQFTAAPNTSAARSGTIVVGGQTFTIAQEGGCKAAVAPDTIAEPASGGTQNVAVTVDAGCTWSAASSASWITIPMESASGVGNGTVPLEIQANAGPARTGAATVAGRTVTVNQDACTIALAANAQAATAAGGPGSVAVTALDGCPWTATSNNMEWLHVTTGAGAGSGTVQFSVDMNATGAQRTGTLTIGGQTFTVIQAGG